MRELRPGLWQGDVHDLNSLKDRKHTFTLAVNVGSTNWLPPDMFTIHFPMKDTNDLKDNDWDRILRLVRFITHEIENGGKVLVSCDAGLSRSVVVSAMVIAVLDMVHMDDDLRRKVRSGLVEPADGLWQHAAATIESWRADVMYGSVY